MKKFSRKSYIVTALFLLVLLVGGVAFALTRPDQAKAPVDTPKRVSAQDVQQSETSSKSTTEAQPTQAQTLPTISKPTLSKSSGNNGPVPSRANIEFTCSGVVNANCFVTLTNQANSSNNLKFDAKTITDDGRGNTSVTWVWEAQPGSWTVKATQLASGYQPNSSDTQTLEVTP
jgi:hypothetical protein